MRKHADAAAGGAALARGPPALRRPRRGWHGRDLPAEPATALFEGARQIVTAADHYLTIQSGILPVASMSEALFTHAYERLARRASDPPALTFMLSFDSELIRAEQSLYDLAAWAATEPVLTGYLQRATSAEIAAAVKPPAGPLSVDDSWRAFCRWLAGHLARFGHAVYDLNLANRLPSDDPAPLLEAMRLSHGRARGPYERQATAASGREEAARSLAARVGTILRRATLRLPDPRTGTRPWARTRSRTWGSAGPRPPPVSRGRSSCSLSSPSLPSPSPWISATKRRRRSRAG